MAARIALFRPAVPAAAVAAVFLAFPKNTVFADSPSSELTAPTRKPIYDDPPPQSSPQADAPSSLSQKASSTLSSISSSISSSLSSSPAPSTSSTSSPPRTPSPTARLATQISHARHFLHSQTVRAEDTLNAGMTRTFNLEHSFTSTLASLAPPPETHEKVGPGMVYVLVAGMAGSIVTRNRTILLRGVFPPAVALGVAWYLLPHTMRNVSELVWEIEKKAPAVARTHVKVKEAVSIGAAGVEGAGKEGARWAAQKIGDGREAVEGWVRKGR